MQNFKKIISSLLSAMLCFSFAACSALQNLPSSALDSESDWQQSATDGENSVFDSSDSADSSDDTDVSDKPTAEQLWAEMVMNSAQELANGETLDGTYQLSGTVTQIDIDYTSSKGVCLYFDVDEPQARELYCYQLKGTGANQIGKVDYITVSGTIKNYKGLLEFDKDCQLISYSANGGGNSGGQGDLPDVGNDPYANVSASAFYANYTIATSNDDAYYRSLHGFMSGTLTTPDQAPTLSTYQPKRNGQFIRNNQTQYVENGKGYVVVDAYGNPAFTVYESGAYIALEEVAAYVYAFGTYPANYTTSKNTDPFDSIWGEYLRLNHTKFSGDTSRYPYEPVLPNITGCGGNLQYYEMDIGTTGTDCDPSYPVELYNDGFTITRGAARIVYGKNDLHVFYTYNHYNDFQEYLNYQGGWGEMFGNITGGGEISSKYYYNPTDYVDVCFAPLTTASSAQALAETYCCDVKQMMYEAVASF